MIASRGSRKLPIAGSSLIANLGFATRKLEGNLFVQKRTPFQTFTATTVVEKAWNMLNLNNRHSRNSVQGDKNHSSFSANPEDMNCNAV